MEIANGKTKIFGQHDEATLKQIQTCVAADGERSVLCANGHGMGDDALIIEGIVVFTSEAKENLHHPAISQIIVTDSIPVSRDDE